MTELEVKMLLEQSSQGQQLTGAPEPHELQLQLNSAVDVVEAAVRPTTILATDALATDVWGPEGSAFLCELRRRPLRKKDSTAKLAYRCLLDQFEAMLREETIAWEGANVEGVHQMRVATRRIRAAFQAFKSGLPPDSSNEFRSEFKWLARVLGNVRDLDVQQDNLRRCLDEFPVEEAACLDDYRQHLASALLQLKLRVTEISRLGVSPGF
jgi:hypothetical protein